MTPQETIETMKIAIAEVEWNYPMEYAIAFENAISALEKQIPKKPIYKLELHMHYCPTCNYPVPVPYKHCPDCGQKLLWGSDTDAD